MVSCCRKNGTEVEGNYLEATGFQNSKFRYWARECGGGWGSFVSVFELKWSSDL